MERTWGMQPQCKENKNLPFSSLAPHPSEETVSVGISFPDVHDHDEGRMSAHGRGEMGRSALGRKGAMRWP